MTVAENSAGLRGGGFHIHDLFTKKATAIIGANLVVRDNVAGQYG